MKISFLEPHLEICGGIRRIIELSNRLTKRGHDVTIFHSDGSSCCWMKCIAKIKSYYEVLNEEHDVLIFNHPSSDYRLFKKVNAKLKIYYVLGLYEKKLLKGLKPSVYLPRNRHIFLLKKSLRSSYLKLSNSTWMYYWLKENMKIESKIVIGGVNREIFRPVRIERNTNEIRILCSGDKRDGKGTSIIYEAVEIAKKNEPRIVLDTYYDKGIPQKEMAEKYCSADIFADAQWDQGWNNPVAEAMACKVPVVCTNIGAIGDIAFNEKTALLVPINDPKAMAFSFLKLIKSEKLRNLLSENAFNHIQKFDLDKSVERFEEVIYSTLSEKKTLISKLRIAIHNPKKVIKKISSLVDAYLPKKGFDKYKQMGAYHWISYEEDPIYRAHVDYINKSFRNKVKGNLLDVGCGDGFISCVLAKNGFDIKGIDIEPEAIKLAQEKCDCVVFEKQSIFDLSEKYDYLLASEVIEHMPSSDEFLNKIKELFFKEAFITTPNKNYYSQPDSYHYREYNIYDFEILLNRHFKDFQIYSTKNHLYAWIKNDKKERC